MSDIVIVLRRKNGTNSSNVDSTIGYCTHGKWKDRFNFHETKRKHKPCLVVMDSLAYNAISDSMDDDIDRVIDYLKSRKLKSLYITGHGEQRKNVVELDWNAKIELFLKKLFIALKEAYSSSMDEKPTEDISLSSAAVSALNTPTNLSFLSSSPLIDPSPKTPSSARRLCDTEVVKEIEESDCEIMKRYILQRAALPHDQRTLEAKIMALLNEIEVVHSPKRQRKD